MISMWQPTLNLKPTVLKGGEKLRELQRKFCLFLLNFGYFIGFSAHGVVRFFQKYVNI